GGVGKTTTVYHIAWMLKELGFKVLAVDLDPQCNLSSIFLTTERMEEIVLEEQKVTVLDAIIPVSEGEPYKPVHIEPIAENLSLLVGNLSLSAFEDTLSDAWTKCLGGQVIGFKITSLFKTLIEDAAQRCHADYILIDVGPNLGAINRAVLISSEFVVLPVAADLFSLQGIKNLGKTLNDWKSQWNKRISEYPKDKDINLIPQGIMKPIGYLIMQYTDRESRPVKSYIKWADRIPQVYLQNVLKTDGSGTPISVATDSNCLAMLKHYHSLAPMSMEAKKPIFLLKPADGAIGAHFHAVRKCYEHFETLTKKILTKVNA
ncbi:MAG: AAA family ATPase, partial [Methylococcales bacterium]